MTAAWQATLVHFLASRGIHADAEDRLIGPHVATLRVRPRTPADVPKVLRMAAEVAAALDVPACALRQSGALIAVEVPLPPHARRRVAFSPLIGAGLRVGLGVSATGRTVTLDLASDRTPHALIMGISGSGKSVLLKAIVAGLLSSSPHGLEVFAIDADRRTFETFARLPQLTHGVIDNARAAADALAAVVRTLNERARSQDEHPPLIVAIDEAQALAGTPAERSLAVVIQRGRKHNVHVLAATQYVNASILHPTIVTQFGARIAGRVDTARTSAQVLGIAAAGAEHLIGNGDMLGVLGGGLPVRFQSCMCQPRDFARLAAMHGTVERADPAPEADPAPTPYYLERRELTAEARTWICERVRIDKGAPVMPGTPGVKQAFAVGTSTARRWIDEVHAELLADLAARGFATPATPAKASPGGVIVPFALPAERREALEA